MFMMSSGGLTAATLFRGKDAILSGPAGGVVGAVQTARMAGLGRIIGFDMGGTSTDVALIENGRPTMVSEVEVDVYPIRTPAIDVVTVGAGGGSLAWLAPGDRLRVGPRSAGAVPSAA